MLCISRGTTRLDREAIRDGYMHVHSYERPLHGSPGYPDGPPCCLQVPQLPEGLPDAQRIHPAGAFHKMERCGQHFCLRASAIIRVGAGAGIYRGAFVRPEENRVGFVVSC